MMLTIEGDHVKIQPAAIRRVRRITGYFSEVNKFNDSKKAELLDRNSHMTLESLEIR